LPVAFLFLAGSARGSAFGLKFQGAKPGPRAKP
jgi:hypothetical protein